MENIIFLVHRLPFPPNKGDKVRSFNMLKYFSSRYNVFLGTFIDDPEDEKYIDNVEKFCVEANIEKINPNIRKLVSLVSFFKGEPLTISYYESRDMARWVKKIVSEKNITKAVVFSSAMAQFILNYDKLELITDFVDVDSEKWLQYSERHKWPSSWVYRRESIKLLTYEKKVALRSKHSFFVTQSEKLIFLEKFPLISEKVSELNNGVDINYFSPIFEFDLIFEKNSRVIVFTGAMDYWPNVDAVLWFSSNVFPLLLDKYNDLVFYIVGRSPVKKIIDLSSKSIFVTGTVLDVRPYLKHATLVVAPLRIARGIQNKILEAMAMECPVVASSVSAAAIDADIGVELLAADSIESYFNEISVLLENPNLSRNIGLLARVRVMEKYSWEYNLSKIDAHISDLLV